jgi:thioredoxin 1
MIEHLDEKTYNEVLVHDRISVVKVFASWCAPCKFLAPHFHKWSNEMTKINDIDISYYQVDNDTNMKFLEQYKVKTLPTILVMVHGACIYKLEGVTRQAVIEDLIKKALRIKVEYNQGVDDE